jgi:hypothetical protein
MRIPLNLARAPGFRERYGLWLAVPGFLLALLLFIWLGTSTLGNFRTLKTVEQSMTQVESRGQDLQRKEASLRQDLARPEAKQLLHETGYVNRLIEARKFSVIELAAKVSKLMPPDVKLGALVLAHPGDEPLIRFTVEGKTEPAIEAFLTNIENSSDFSGLIVTSQSYPGGEEAGPITTGCSAHYRGGAIEGGTETDINAGTETSNDSSNR